MTSDEVIDSFRAAGALLEGHFEFTSGRHGRQFLQAARVLQYPKHTDALCRTIAEQFSEAGVALVVGPATGGIILAYETARHLECRAAFTEKTADGSMALKRGFHLQPGTRTIVVEDITTTGGSIWKTVDHLRKRGAEIVGVSVLIDRSGGEAVFDCPYVPLASLPMESWTKDECPMCSEGLGLVEPDDLIV